MINKSYLVADGDRINISMPIAKVDKESRLVSGFATLDNVDKSADVVTADASRGAFSSFVGNIREMHQPIAVGKLTDFSEQEFYHKGEHYRGIYATVYVSKGAQDTWEKVLDGTLTGFSIGGNIVEQRSEFVKDATGGRTVRYIEKYDLKELSLVDNPCNQLANFDSIAKVFSIDGDLSREAIEKNTVRTIFWCGTDEIAKHSHSETESCVACGNKMQDIGWLEKGEDAASKIAATVTKFLGEEAGDKTSFEGGVNMTDENKADDVVTSAGEGSATTPVDLDKQREENGPIEEVTAEGDGNGLTGTDKDPYKESGTASTDEKVEEVSTEPDLEKMFDDLKDSVKESITKNIATVEGKIEEVTKAWEAKASDLEKSIKDFGDKLEESKATRENIAKRLEVLEGATAIKKSGEVETQPEPVQKRAKESFWGGTFFGSE